MSYLLTNTGPSVGLASHICWRRRGRYDPNCMAPGLVDKSVESLSEGVILSGASEEL